MDIELLREYLVIAEEANFTHAAKRLHTTQSTLSKHVASLEKEFGQPLFKRNRRDVALTEAGVVLRRRASTLIDLYEDTLMEVASVKEKDPVKATGMLQNADVVSVLSLAAQRAQGSEETHVSLVPVILESFSRALLQKTVDIVVGHDGLDAGQEAGVKVRRLFSKKMFALVDLDHPLAGRSSLAFDELRDETLVHLAGEYAMGGWATVERVCRSHGFEPKSHVVNVDGGLIECLATPLGGAVLLLQRGLLPSEMFFGGQRESIPIEDDDACFTVCAYYRAEDEERLAVFLELLEAAAQPHDMAGSGDASGAPKGRFERQCDVLAEEVGLNDTEAFALRLFAKGRSIERIGQELELSRMVTGDLLASAYRKVGVVDRQDLLDRIEAVELAW